jgi:hypothetical protein
MIEWLVDFAVDEFLADLVPVPVEGPSSGWLGRTESGYVVSLGLTRGSAPE